MLRRQGGGIQVILGIKNYSRIHCGAQFRKISAPYRTENPHPLRRYPNPKRRSHEGICRENKLQMHHEIQETNSKFAFPIQTPETSNRNTPKRLTNSDAFTYPDHQTHMIGKRTQILPRFVYSNKSQYHKHTKVLTLID